ncbi:MAG: alkaline phosphatase family protein [Actinomycetota bacterium]
MPSTATDALPEEFVIPDYSGPCVTNVVPALLEHPSIGDGWMPSGVDEARAVVLFVVDGLGWNQLRARTSITPVLSAGQGGPITTVAPSTTAAALTSISTGAPPGEHGIVGYKIRVGGDTLNCLRWATGRGDARSSIPPREFQPLPAFGGRSPVVVNKAEFVGSGLTVAHHDGVDYRGYGTLSALVWEVEQAIAAGERFVYTYYDGLDRAGHERGHGGAFDAEFAFVDRLVGDLRAALPDEVALLVTADHGQVDTTGHVHHLAPELKRRIHAVSGEDRFVWLHASDPIDALMCARDVHGEHAHAMTADEVVERGLLGRMVSSAARERLGDVALIAKQRNALVDPVGRIPNLLGRHGSLTADEMLVPLLSI